MAFFFFLYLMGPETCPFVDLGPSLWTLDGFGPFLFLIESLNTLFFLGFNPLFCFGPWYNIVIFWTSTFSLRSLWVACSPLVSRQDFLICEGIPSLLFQLVSGSPFSFPWNLASLCYPLVSWSFTCYNFFCTFPSLHEMWQLSV